MRKIVFLLASIIALVYNASYAQYDDVYYDPSKSSTTSTKVVKNVEEKDVSAPLQDDQLDGQQSENSKAYQYDGVEASDGNTYITNNYYNDDSYNDYFYTSRLRRYYQPSYGFGYWDNYYTNYYFYDNNPWSWGNNIYSYTPNYYWNPWGIYIGYSTWGSHNGWNWGRPCYAAWYDPYGWNSGWNNNYYGYNGYYGYNNGYGNGYYNGYNNGYNNGYYNGYYNGYNNNYAYGGGYDYGYWGPRKQMMDADGLPSNTSGIKTASAIDNGRNDLAAPSNPSQVTTGRASDFTTKSDVPLNVKTEPTQITTTTRTVNEIPRSGVVTERSNSNTVAPSNTNNGRTYTNNSTESAITPDSRGYHNETPPGNGNYGRTEMNAGGNAGSNGNGNRPVTPPSNNSNTNNSRPVTPPNSSTPPSNTNSRPASPPAPNNNNNSNNSRSVTPPSNASNNSYSRPASPPPPSNTNNSRTVTAPSSNQSSPPAPNNRVGGNAAPMYKPR